jgi:serine/threonine protein kinase
MQIFPGMIVKLSDFGLARTKHREGVTVASHGGAGTLPYMAPEVHVGTAKGGKSLKALPSSDVWSMSAAMVEWFTGRHPWSYKSRETYPKELKEKKKKQVYPEQLANVPDIVKSLLTLGLHYDYTQRPKAAEMRMQLQNIAGNNLTLHTKCNNPSSLIS